MDENTLNKRIPIVLSVILLISALIIAVRSELLPFAVWRHFVVPSTPIHVNAVRIGTINKQIIIARSGIVESSTIVPVHTEFSGCISEILVTEGQPVKAGQPLLKLQPGSTSGETANQGNKASQLSQDNYEKALKELDRYKELYELGAISRVQLENAKNAVQVAQEGLAGRAPVIKGVNGTATIEAPIDGIVKGLIAATGKMVQAGQQVMVLGSGREIEIVVRLEQPDLYLVNLGTPVTIEAAGQILKGQVTVIYPEVESNQVSAFLVHIKVIDDIAGALTPGMSANIRVDAGPSATVLAVPTAALLDDQGQRFIYVADNGKAIHQQVSIGETIGDFTEITSNISSETTVIISNLSKIQNGDSVVVLQNSHGM